MNSSNTHSFRGALSAAFAAAIVATFSFLSCVGSLACSMLPRRVPHRLTLAVVGALMALVLVLRPAGLTGGRELSLRRVGIG